MKIRVVSDGTRSGTKITDAVTGNDLGGSVVGIAWSIRADERVATVTIEWFASELDLEVTGEVADPPPEIDFRTGQPKAAEANRIARESAGVMPAGDDA